MWRPTKSGLPHGLQPPQRTSGRISRVQPDTSAPYGRRSTEKRSAGASPCARPARPRQLAFARTAREAPWTLPTSVEGSITDVLNPALAVDERHQVALPGVLGGYGREQLA